MFKEVIVVEGNHDTAKIKSVFKDAEVMITNGREISKETLDVLKKLNEERGLILCLDPDTPGERIRSIINEAVGPTKHVFLPKEHCIDEVKKKVGIEHAPKHIIYEAFMKHIKESDEVETISLSALYRLKLIGHSDSKERRNRVSEHFKIGQCNGKTLHKRLNMFKITEDAIRQVLS